MNKSKPGSDGDSKDAIFIFLFLTSSFFRLVIKPKPDGRIRNIALVFFFFIVSSLKHLQRPTSMLAADHIFLPLNWLINQFFCQFHSLSTVILTHIIMIIIVSVAKNESMFKFKLVEIRGLLLSIRRFVPYLQQYHNLGSIIFLHISRYRDKFQTTEQSTINILVLLLFKRRLCF